jgi:hypothetical protein
MLFFVNLLGSSANKDFSALALNLVGLLVGPAAELLLQIGLLVLYLNHIKGHKCKISCIGEMISIALSIPCKFWLGFHPESHFLAASLFHTPRKSSQILLLEVVGKLSRGIKVDVSQNLLHIHFL